MNKIDSNGILNICRWSLGLIFIYHGLFPKIIWLSQTEVSLIVASGINMPINLVTSFAGIGEIFLGVLIIFTRNKIPIYIAFILLGLLLLYVAIVNFKLLFEAFNPVTTNLPAMILCYIILRIEQN